MKKIDLALLLVAPFLASVLSLFLKANFLTTTLLFFGLPSIYLSLRAKRLVKKTAIFSLIFTPFGLAMDYLGLLDKSWYVTQSVFPFRVFGLITIEEILWGYLLIYGIIIFYEYFLDKGKNVISKNQLINSAVIFGAVFVIFLVLLTKNPRILQINYFYFKSGLLLIFLPTISFLLAFPKLLSKFIRTGTYFFALALLNELTSLSLGHWIFPGVNFIGWVEILGNRFPYEEFFFWFVLFTAALLSYYEFFADDRK